MSAASKKSKTQRLKERWENGELDCGAMTPEFIKGLSPRELGMLGELITIDYFNERGYTLLEQGYRCTEGEADLVLLDELDDVVVMAEVKTRRVALDCTTRVFPEEAVDAQKQRRYRRIASCYLMEHYPLKAIRFDAVGVTIRGGHIAENRASVQRVRLAGVVMAFETFAVHAACIRGVEAIHVTVEVSLAGGVPGIQMLGIPSMEVMESRGRIRCAMRSAGFESHARALRSIWHLAIFARPVAALIFPSPSRYWRPMVRFPATTSIVVLSPVSLAWTVRCFPSRARWRFSYWRVIWGCLLSPADQTSMCHSRAWIADS